MMRDAEQIGLPQFRLSAPWNIDASSKPDPRDSSPFPNVEQLPEKVESTYRDRREELSTHEPTAGVASRSRRRARIRARHSLW
jgi:hypothetical protein